MRKYLVSTGMWLSMAVLTLGTTLPLISCDGDTGSDSSGSTRTISITTTGSGTATADKDKVASGTVVTLKATPAPGHAFFRWTIISGDAMLALPMESETTIQVLLQDVVIRAEFGDPTVEDPGVTVGGITWATRNVGLPGNFAANLNDGGWIYQLGRPLAWTVVAPITSYPVNYPDATWDSTDPDTSSGWGENDPCPDGWRVPTAEELGTLIDGSKVKSVWGTDTDTGTSKPGFSRTATESIYIPGRTFVDLATNETVFFPAQGVRRRMALRHSSARQPERKMGHTRLTPRGHGTTGLSG